MYYFDPYKFSSSAYRQYVTIYRIHKKVNTHIDMYIGIIFQGNKFSDILTFFDKRNNMLYKSSLQVIVSILYVYNLV